MEAILLAIGDELTSGQTLETNSAWLAQQLAKRGIWVRGHRTVRDDRADIAAALAEAADAAELVLVTGGLGPTADDLTRQGLAQAMGAELVTDDDSLRQIEDFFARRNRPMNEGNRIQAMLPESAEVLPNPIGTAPGIAARVGGSLVLVMPGVPREMRKMFQEQIAPRLANGEKVILFSSVHLAGIGESDAGGILADLMCRSGDVIVGTTASGGTVSARITARGSSLAQAQQRIEQVAGQIRDRLGSKVFGEGEATLASAVGDLLTRRGQSVSTAESCTGGLVAKLLTDVPGSSGYFRGSVVAYDNQVKQRLLGVASGDLEAHGAVSQAVAAAMARGARSSLGTDWALSTTGIAGPGGGSGEKPVGLVYLAVAWEGGTQVFEHRYPGDRETMRLRTALGALDHLRRRLLGPQEARDA
jgi:nicotinamide-nucleotide amidase